MPTIAPDDEDLTITIDGQTLEGWTGVRVVRGVERLPSGCVVEFTEQSQAYQAISAVSNSDLCKVYLGEDLILTGFLDLYWPHEDRETHVVRAEIRSKPCDLVDCSLAPGLTAASALDIVGGKMISQWVQKICAPFNIDIWLPDGDPVLPEQALFVINPGMTCAQLIEDMARTVQLLMWDDPKGELVLSKVGTRRAGSLAEGVNCEVGEARLSMTQRFSTVTVVGQAQVLEGFKASWAHQNDVGVSRYRPKLVVMDVPGLNGSNDWAQQRANWEVARRYGRSRIVDVTVTGWRDGNGNLWTPNTIVNCNLPSLKINEDMLIAECAWLRGEAGTSTVMTLMPPQGFQPMPFHYPAPFQDDGKSSIGTATTDQIVAAGGT